MIFEEKRCKLKDGREALFRSPCEDDAEEMLRFIIRASGETDYLMKFPEEYADFTLEQEKAFMNDDPLRSAREAGRKLPDLLLHRHEGPSQSLRCHRASAGVLGSRDRDENV